MCRCGTQKCVCKELAVRFKESGVRRNPRVPHVICKWGVRKYLTHGCSWTNLNLLAWRPFTIDPDADSVR